MKAAIHEMRNHLSVAMATIEAFLDRKLAPTDARLSAVFAALHELDLLIDDLPSEQTIQLRTHGVPIDVCRLITSQVTAMEGFAAECGVRLTLRGCEETHADCSQFFGDPVRIAEIVTNILMNAIRHTPSSGEVHVDIDRDRRDFRFCVSDEGPGIDDDERTHIFERGFCGASVASRSGSGIGLALVKQFVDREGGAIVVSDSPLGGAKFEIVLPGQSRDDACALCGTPHSLQRATTPV